ncbi:phage tail protein [Yokenella regensburgei]|uniref:phage tail protein n=1 Tax=Yokenella regensburgei TaxID=158877 RepID=UPI003ED8B83F
MSTKYKTIITHAGAEKFAAATLPGGKKVNITMMAIGDGGGSLPEPNAAQTQLINEVWRHPLNKISQDNKKKNYIVAELVIPPEVGGFWSREMGLYDDTGTMVAVANMAESYKPELAEGSGRAQTVRMVIMVCDITSVELSIDGSVVMATKDYVDDTIAEHEKSRRHPDASLTEKGFTRLNSAADSVDETAAATPKAVKIAMDNASARLAKERNLADLPNPALARQSLQLGDSATKNTGTTANTVAAGDDNRIVGAMQRGQNGADIPDKDLFVRTAGAARAYSASIGSGLNANATTAEFIVWLEAQGAFNHPYWMCRGSWSYADNKTITDTGCGHIHLAGAVIEVMGSRDAMTIRITTSSTTTSGGIANAQFTYINNGDAYAPGWRRDYNTVNKPSASDVGAVSANGGSYNHTFKFGRVETLPQEQNPAALFSQTGPDGSIVSGVEFNWYGHKAITGIVRNGSDGTKGFAITLDGNQLMSLDPNGNLGLRGNAISSGTIMGLQNDSRQHFSMMNADGSPRAYIYKDKGGEGIVVLNPEGGGEFVFGKNGHLKAPAVFQTSGSPAGAGAFAQQLQTVAPFYMPRYTSPKDTSHYIPICKGISNTEVHDYSSAVSFGILRSGVADFGAAVIQIIGDNGTGAIYTFQNNGTFVAPGPVLAGSASLATNGDLSGPAWGGFLSGWLNTQFANSNNIAQDAWNKANDAQINSVRASRRGPQQYINPGENGIWNGFEIPNGYFSGTRNHTDDGNAKFNEYYYRVQQIYIQSAGWVDTSTV